MNITLSLGDFLMIAALIVIFGRLPFTFHAGAGAGELRARRQLDAIMGHLGLPEPVVSKPGALSPPVLALLAAGRKIEAIRLYRQETGADLKIARSAIDIPSP